MGKLFIRLWDKIHLMVEKQRLKFTIFGKRGHTYRCK